MTTDDDPGAVKRRLREALTYATNMVFIGPHPDRPGISATHAFDHEPGPCFLTVAALLREAADDYERRHGSTPCGPSS